MIVHYFIMTLASNNTITYILNKCKTKDNYIHSESCIV